MYRQLGYFQRKRLLKTANFLDLVPIRNVASDTDADGNAVLLIPKFRKWPLNLWLQPRLKHPIIRLSLDEIGSAVWTLCDGKREVRSICSDLTARFGEKVQPATDRVTSFLSSLYKQELIVFRQLLRSPD